MRNQGRVTVHPKADWGSSSRVDFRVEPDSSEPFILEARTFFGESEVEQKARLVVGALCDAVNQVDSPNHFLDVRIDGTATKQPSSKELQRFLKEKLRGLNPDEFSTKEPTQRTTGIDEWVYSANGVKLTFTPTPKPFKLRGKSGVRTLGILSAGSAKVGDLVDDLREQLRKKAKKYGTPPLPLVIALNVLDVSYEGHHELAQALFGTVRERVRLSYPLDDEAAPPLVESHVVQDPDGLLFDGQTPHCREVSGVLVFDGVLPSTLGVVTARLFLNPFANHPLKTGLNDFPRTLVRDGALVHEDGKSVADLLRLPAGWPGTEPGQ